MHTHTSIRRRATTPRSRRSTVLLASAALLSTALPAVAAYETPTRVSGSTPDFADAGLPKISPDGRWMVFRSDRGVDDVMELWTVRLDGTEATPVRLNKAPVPGGDVGTFAISPDSQKVVFLGDLDRDESHELYWRPIDGSGTTSPRLNSRVEGGTAHAALDVSEFQITPDSAQVLFTADLEVDGRDELYRRVFTGSQAQFQIKVNETASGTGVHRFEVTPSATRVVYNGDLDGWGDPDLYSRWINPHIGSGEQVLLNTDASAAGTFSIAPDSSRVAYSDGSDYGGPLFSVATDGSSAPIRLSDPPSEGFGAVYRHRITSDSRYVVFSGDLQVDGRIDVYSRPLDGSFSQVRLNSIPQGTGDVRHYRLAPDGSRVVYGGDLAVDGRLDLYSRPVDGSGDQVTLAAGADAARGVDPRYLFTSDGRTVVFAGDLEVDGRRDLYARQVDGSGALVRISEPVEGGGLAIWASDRAGLVSDDRVAYVGSLLDPTRVEVFARRLDGTGPQVRLNPPMVAGGAANRLVVGPDGSFVVYAADQTVDERFELFATSRHRPAATPTEVTSTEVTERQATIAWTQSTQGSEVTSTTVTAAPTDGTTPSSRSTSSAEPVSVTVAGGATRVTLTGLEPDTTYEVTVRAINDAGASEPSAPITLTTAAETTDDPPDDDRAGPGEVVRLEGPDRYATAAAVALDRFEPAAVQTVLLATGTAFPDALTGGPLAAHLGAPILLTRPDALPDVTRDAIAALGPARVVALGGTSAVSDGVLAAAAAAAGSATTDRLWGPDRYATAVAIAGELPASGDVYLATGTNYPDALAGGPATGGAPILLASGSTLPTATAEALGRLAPDRVIALGGTASVSDEVLEAAAEAAAASGTLRRSGGDRYATALAVADTLPTPSVLYVATGTGYPDAVAAAPAANGEAAPIVLTRPEALPDDVAAWVEALPGLRRVVVLGGPTAISTDVEAALAAYLDS